MRAVLILILLALLAGCQNGPAGPGPAHKDTYRERYGGMCSPYASNCW